MQAKGIALSVTSGFQFFFSSLCGSLHTYCLTFDTCCTYAETAQEFKKSWPIIRHFSIFQINPNCSLHPVFSWNANCCFIYTRKGEKEIRHLLFSVLVSVVELSHNIGTPLCLFVYTKIKTYNLSKKFNSSLLKLLYRWCPKLQPCALLNHRIHQLKGLPVGYPELKC